MKCAIQLELKGGGEDFGEMGAGFLAECDEVATEQNGTRRGLAYRKLVGAGAKFFDQDKRFRSVQGRATEAVGDHDRAEIVDGGGEELACEPTDMGVAEIPSAMVVGEVEHHQRTHALYNSVGGADALKERIGNRPACSEPGV